MIIFGPGAPWKSWRTFVSFCLPAWMRIRPARWNGRLLAKSLGQSADRVWRELRHLGISLQRRRSWCVSTDPQFSQKADRCDWSLLESSG